MLKKMFTGIIAGAAMFGMVGTSAAADFTVTIAGASAQGGYWGTAGEAFLEKTYGCTDTAKAYQLKDGETAGTCSTEKNKKKFVVRGTGCSVDGTGSNDDTVYIQYKEIASYAGCENAPGCADEAFIDVADCNFTAGTCDCSEIGGDATLPTTVGASDVACEDLDQSTFGYEDGYEGYTGGQSQQPFGPYDSELPSRMVVNRPIVVPFGFIANNTVVKNRCTTPTHAAEADTAHKAYDHFWWQCVKGNNYACADDHPTDVANEDWVEAAKTKCHGGPKDYAECTYKEDCADNGPASTDVTSEDCIGYYKCVDGTCSGGVNATQSCTKNSECPDVLVENTTCEEVPLDNLSRLQAMLIFSDTVAYWDDFGPFYPHNAIIKCMRHAGSGTHATLTKAVFREKYNIDLKVATNDVIPTVWHYRSSSDLTSDCVNRWQGAVGYVDADKVMGGAYGNTHQLKYEGVEPTRLKIRNGEYAFWAEQMIFYDPNCVDDTVEDIIDDLAVFASNPQNLTEDLFGYRAGFWATRNEMQYTRNGDVDEFPQ